MSYLAERRCGEISDYLDYACCSWAFHFTHADHSNGSDTLKDFFERHLLRWMDCLSILGKLEIAMDSLLKLRNWVSDLVIIIYMSLKKRPDTRPVGNESD